MTNIRLEALQPTRVLYLLRQQESERLQSCSEFITAVFRLEISSVVEDKYHLRLNPDSASIFSMNLPMLCRHVAGNKRPLNNETVKRPGTREPGGFGRLGCGTGEGLNGGQIRKNHD